MPAILQGDSNPIDLYSRHRTSLPSPSAVNPYYAYRPLLHPFPFHPWSNREPLSREPPLFRESPLSLENPSLSLENPLYLSRIPSISRTPSISRESPLSREPPPPSPMIPYSQFSSAPLNLASCMKLLSTLCSSVFMDLLTQWISKRHTIPYRIRRGSTLPTSLAWPRGLKERVGPLKSKAYKCNEMQ